MWHKARHTLAYKCAGLYYRNLYKRKINFKAKRIVLPKGPTVILINHQTTYDPFLVYAALKNVSYFMIAKEFIKLKNRKKLEYWSHPVWKSKTLTDLKSVKDSLQVLKEGNNLVIFPEGNRTFSGELCYVDPSITKLIKRSKANVAYLNFEGGYGVEPRFSKDIRKGKMTLKLRSYRTKEEIEAMSNDDLYKDIITNLTVTEAPSTQEFISSSRAEYLERIFFRCPCCNNLNTIYSEGNKVKCSSCNLEVTYGSHLTFENPSSPSFKFKTVAQWYENQIDYIKNFKIDDSIIFSEENASLEMISLEKEEYLLEDQHLSLSKDKLVIGKEEFLLDSIIDMTVSGKQTFLFYVDDKTYRISSKINGFNALKYMLMFYHIKNQNKKEDDIFLGI